jgi:hypothetical protein
MRLVLSLSFICIGAAASLAAQTVNAQHPIEQVPFMTRVQPDNGKIGSVLRVHGVYLGKTKVDEMYLTDHTFDMKCKVLDQAEDYIEFRIPPSVKPGRLQLLVKTTGREPVLLEQPVYITVQDPTEQPKEPLEASAAAPAPSTATK